MMQVVRTQRRSSMVQTRRVSPRNPRPRTCGSLVAALALVVSCQDGPGPGEPKGDGAVGPAIDQRELELGHLGAPGQ